MRLNEGFAVYDGVFDLSEMTAIVRAIEQSDVARTKAGARHLLQVPAVRALASDPRLVDLATGILGAGAFPFRATLFDKSLVVNWLVTWHQDTALPVRTRTDHPGWGPWTTKRGVLHAIAPGSALERVIALRVHLDDSTSESGPLRVLPDTHACGVLDAATIAGLAATVSQVECVTTTGGVIAMRPLIVHASSKARVDRPRRVVHIEYASDVRLDRDVELAVG